ncbi:MAG: FG-GAP-like repeat-containing protein [Steroidobacter sp.]
MKRLWSLGLDAIVASVFLIFVTGCGGGSGSGGASSGPPNAVAGNSQTVFKRTTVTLDGSGSSDPDGHSLSYTWKQTAGTSVVLSSNSSAKPTFVAPGVSDQLTFSLTVSNGTTTSTPSTVVIKVQNRAPVATLSPAMTAGTGTTVILDGSASTDPDQDPLTYTWTQTSGASVALIPASGGKASFTTPSDAGTLVFSLVVNDGETDSVAATETVSVTVGGGVNPPVASAGTDITTPKRAPVALHGTVMNSNGVSLTYSWKQTSGATVTLQNADSLNPTFTAPATTGDMTFSLVVKDSFGSSTPSTVTVHVTNSIPIITNVALTPSSPKRNDPISVTVSISDVDNDPLAVTYVWTRNGTPVSSATGSSYPSGNQAKGDVIAVQITASDGDLSASDSATITIQDTPATLTAKPPTTVTYGTPASFKVTATDIDGDPTGPIEVDYGPAGFTVDSSGQVSWTPNGPMFDQSVDVNWAVRLANEPTVKLGGTITVTDPTRKLPMVRSNPGIPVGNNAIDIEDFDGSGKYQALVGAYQSVYLLEKSGSDYQQTWVYPFEIVPGSTISAVASGDVDGDGHREIFIADGPVVVKLDGVTRRETGRFGVVAANGNTPAGPYCTALRYADIDNDGKGDLICLGADSDTYDSTSRIYVLDAETMQVKWQTPSLLLGTSMAVGNVDSDSALEIVTNNGYVFDGVSQQNQWAYGSGFGSVVDIGDVMGDGVGKIVGLNAGVAARVFDAVLKSPIWEIPAGTFSSGESALKVSDLDGTSPAEIIVGDGQWGNVTVYRYNSVTKSADTLAQIPVPGDGVSGIAAGGINGDGQKEIVFGSDYYSSGRDYLTVGTWTPTAAASWSGPLPAQLDGPFYGAKLAQIASGKKELMFMTPGTNSGYDGTRVIAMDPVTGTLSVSDEVDTNWSHDFAFDVGNVLGNGIDEMLIGTASTYTDYFTAFDFAANAKIWSSGTTSGGGGVVVHSDVNQDGIDDLIGITSSGYIYAYDVAHQSLIWSSTGLGGGRDVAVSDLDGDGVPEIVALTGTQIVIYAKTNGTYLQHLTYTVTGSSLLVADANGDGKPEIYVLGVDSIYQTGTTIYQLDNNLILLNSYAAQGATAIFLEQSAFLRKNLIVATADTSYGSVVPSVLKIVDPSSGSLVWTSPPLLGNVSAHSLSFNDLNSDGNLKMAIGTTVGMYLTQ